MFFQKILQLRSGQEEKINIGALQKVFEEQKHVLQQNGTNDMFSADIFEKETQNAWQRLKNAADAIALKPFGSLPLLLVANFKDARQGIEKIKGHTELTLENITGQRPKNTFEILLDVEDGRKMVAKSPKDALKKFEKQKRSALTINESIALLTHHPDVLKNHYLISAGSFYTTGDNESLPLLWLLDDHHNPELHYAWFHIAHGSYGAGSYAVKI